ncbi:MAG: 16S rRNA (uracil(1498)-N(3))-methyltransferase [Moraxellaceae bacterium]|nr:MAG: 16S rRNA (uracil(1498)-N(3))-methyltransferase [Moraxellaceae bacterium]
MNLVLIFESDFIRENTVRLKERRLEHIQNILQAEPGQTLKVGFLNGLIGLGKVTEITQQFVDLEVELYDNPPASIPITAILALPRPKMVRRIIQNIASIGVKELYFINSYHVEKSYWQSPALKAETIREHLIHGLEQGQDTVMPNVHLRKRFKPFMEDELPSIAQNAKLRLLAHPYNSQPCPQELEGNTIIALGPERGFTKYEADKFIDNQFKPTSLGKRILKVEIALTFLLGKLCP